MKKFFASLSLIALMAVPLPAAHAVELLDPVCTSRSSQSAVCQDNSGAQTGNNDLLFGRNGILTKAVNIFSIVVGVVAVIVIIISGLRIIMSTGDSNTVTSARNAILYAIIGLIIASLAQTIVRLVLYRIGG